MPTKKGALRGPRNPTVDSYIRYLRLRGIVEIPDPYGEGYYTIKLKPEQNGYGYPDLYWHPNDGKNKNPKAVRGNRTRYGWFLQWYPKGIGWERMYGRHYFMYRGTDNLEKQDRKKAANLCRMLVGMIITGVRLNGMSCGDVVSAETAKYLTSQEFADEVRLWKFGDDF